MNKQITELVGNFPSVKKAASIKLTFSMEKCLWNWHFQLGKNLKFCLLNQLKYFWII